MTTWPRGLQRRWLQDRAFWQVPQRLLEHNLYTPEDGIDWFVPFSSGDLHYFDYDVNDQGTIRHFGTKDSDYKTDVLSRKTNAFHRRRASQRHKPFFAYVAPTAPHDPATPAPRDAHTYDGVNGSTLALLQRGAMSRTNPPGYRRLPKAQQPTRLPP